MVNVDVKKINESIKTYKNVINNLSNNDISIEGKFNELKRYWNNPNSVKLYNALDSTTKQVKYLESDMKSQLDVYSYISNSYSRLGNKVYFNNDNVSYIDYKLDVIVDQFEFILSQWGSIGLETGRAGWFPKFRTIFDLRNDYLKARDAFDDIKEAIDNKMDYIKNVENEVSRRVNNVNVENIVVNNFDIHNK